MEEADEKVDHLALDCVLQLPCAEVRLGHLARTGQRGDDIGAVRSLQRDSQNESADCQVSCGSHTQCAWGVIHQANQWRRRRHRRSRKARGSIIARRPRVIGVMLKRRGPGEGTGGSTPEGSATPSPHLEEQGEVEGLGCGGFGLLLRIHKVQHGHGGDCEGDIHLARCNNASIPAYRQCCHN